MPGPAALNVTSQPGSHSAVRGGGARGKTGSGGKAPGKGGLNSPLYDPSQTLTGPALNQAATQIANAQTTGPISELAAQIAANNKAGAAQQKDVFGYYMQLGQLAQQAVANDKTTGAGLSSQLADLASGTQAQLGQIGQNAQSGALARMNALGLDAGQTQALGNETARQQGIGALNAQTFQSAGANQNANFTSNAANNKGVDALAGTQGITQLGQATRFADQPLNTKIASLIASKGALKATALGQLRTAERNYQIAEQGLGQKGAALKLTAAQDQARNALTAAGITASGQRTAAEQAGATSRSNAAIAGENWREQQSVAGAASRNAASIAARTAIADAKAAQAQHKPLSTLDQNRLYGQMDTIGALIQDARTNGFPANTKTGQAANPKPSQAQITALLLDGRNPRGIAYPRPLVDAVFELRQTGFVSAATAAQLRALGLRGGSFNGKPIRVSGNYPNAGQGAANAGQGAAQGVTGAAG